jgi:hypothetical protein
LFRKVKDVNDSDDIFEKRGQELILVDFSGSIPKASGKLTVDSRLNWCPELATRVLDADRAFV